MEKILRDKIRKVFDNLKNVDVIFLMNTEVHDPNFLYITGFKTGLYEGDRLIITKDMTYHFASPLSYETAMLEKKDGMRVIKATKATVVKKWMKKLIGRKRVAVNGQFLPVNLYQMLKKRYNPKKMVDASDAFQKVRM